LAILAIYGSGMSSTNGYLLKLARMSLDDVRKAAKDAGVPNYKKVSRADIVDHLWKNPEDALLTGMFDSELSSVDQNEDQMSSNANDVVCSGLVAMIGQLKEEINGLRKEIKSGLVEKKELESLKEEVVALRTHVFSSPEIVGTTHKPTANSTTSTCAPSAGSMPYAQKLQSPAMHQHRPRRANEKLDDPRRFVLRPQASGESKGLSGAKKVERSVLHLGNIGMKCTANDVVSHCKEKGVTVTACTLFSAERAYGTLQARVTIDASNLPAAMGKGFWPKHVTVRAWGFGERIALRHIHPSVTATTVLDICAARGITATSCEVLPPRKSDGMSTALLWIAPKDVDKALSCDDWPDNVRAERGRRAVSGPQDPAAPLDQ